MSRSLTGALLIGLTLSSPGLATAQEESKAAATTRKKLQQTLTIEAKEIGIKNFLEDINNELDAKKQIRFKIDNATGVSNNMKVSYKGKDVTVEQVLNDLADKFDFGYYVVSNAANNKEDGMVLIRKSSKAKERGYEAGKEPPRKEGGKEQPSRLAPLPVALPPVFGAAWEPPGGTVVRRQHS
jgi:hypothetical protein